MDKIDVLVMICLIGWHAINAALNAPPGNVIRFHQNLFVFSVLSKHFECNGLLGGCQHYNSLIHVPPLHLASCIVGLASSYETMAAAPETLALHKADAELELGSMIMCSHCKRRYRGSSEWLVYMVLFHI